MKILVTGSRDWSNVECVIEILKKYKHGTILIHGECRGADTICSAVAEALEFEIRTYPADWKRLKRAAGPIRNQLMIDTEHTQEQPINICIAFHDDIGNSRGTLDMVERAMKANIQIEYVTSLKSSQ